MGIAPHFILPSVFRTCGLDITLQVTLVISRTQLSGRRGGQNRDMSDVGRKLTLVDNRFIPVKQCSRISAIPGPLVLTGFNRCGIGVLVEKSRGKEITPWLGGFRL